MKTNFSGKVEKTIIVFKNGTPYTRLPLPSNETAQRFFDKVFFSVSGLSFKVEGEA